MDEYDEMDALLEYLFNFTYEQPQSNMWLIDPGRYRDMMNAALNIQRLLKRECYDIELKLEFCFELNSGQIVFEAADFSVSDTSALQTILSKANHAVFFPNANGNLQVEICFRNVLHDCHLLQE